MNLAIALDSPHPGLASYTILPRPFYHISLKPVSWPDETMRPAKSSCVAAGQAVTAFLGERVTLTSYWRRVSLGPEIEVSWFKLGPGEEQVLIGRMHHDVIFIEWPFRGFFDIHRSAVNSNREAPILFLHNTAICRSWCGLHALGHEPLDVGMGKCIHGACHSKDREVWELRPFGVDRQR